MSSFILTYVCEYCALIGSCTIMSIDSEVDREKLFVGAKIPRYCFLNGKQMEMVIADIEEIRNND